MSGRIVEHVSQRIAEAQVTDLVDANPHPAAGPGMGKLMGDNAGKGYIRQDKSHHILTSQSVPAGLQREQAR
jgi:hypothetical protein